jgi:hypothetical protein
MAQPISEDMQLAAETVLQSSSVRRIKLECDDYDDVRNEYSTAMRKSLKPVGDAILAARPVQLPATIDATWTTIDNAGLNNSLLPPSMEYSVRGPGLCRVERRGATHDQRRSG